MRWKGTVDGEDTAKSWTGHVELIVNGTTVIGSIKWVSNKGYSGTEKVKGSLKGDVLDLAGDGIKNDKGYKPLATTQQYLGRLTSEGHISFKWFPKSKTVPKGEVASGRLEKFED